MNDNKNKKTKVILGLSGGVDSSVCAYLLKEQNYDVTCMYMKNWDSVTNYDILGNPTINDEICPQEKDYNDAKKVADSLNLPIKKVDFVKEYWDNVFTYFLNEYKNNRTPNPDVLCNNEIKFKAFLNKALEENADYIAMGHYARKEFINGKYHLLKGIDKNKDQSYFLCQLTPYQISKALFPIGNLNKEEVRQIAKKLNLATALKKDSTGICFIGERNFNKFLQNYLPAQKGDICFLDGTIVGKHNGLMNYTIGQRKGLGLGTINNIDGPWFVCGKDVAKNILYICNNDNIDYLKSDKALITDVVWRGDYLDKNYYCKFRYRQKDVKCEIKFIDETSFNVFYNDVIAVTPGQFCAVYDENDICLGGGIINKVYYKEEIRKY